MNDESRILKAHGVSEADWAVLFTVSYHTPLPLGQVVELAALEFRSEPLEDIPDAIQTCLERGWITMLHDIPDAPGENAVLHRGGIVLTEVGLKIKESLSEDLMATVLRAPPAVRQAC